MSRSEAPQEASEGEMRLQLGVAIYAIITISIPP